MSEDEDGKNGRRRLTVERKPQEVLAMSDVRTSPFGAYDLIDWLSGYESQ
jgi:RNA polymerase sigma-70 factor (ECF subfamily)